MKKQSTMGGFAVLSSAVLIVKILSLLYLPFLLAIIGDEGFGIYMAAYQIFVLIFAVTTSGLPQAISKIVSELTATGNYRDAAKAFRLARFLLLCGGIVMAAVLWLSARPLTNILHYQRSYYAVLALCPTIVLATLTSSYRGYFQGTENMVPTALSQIIEQVVNIVFTLLLAYLLIGRGVEAACAGGSFATSIASFVAAVFLIWTYKKNKEDSNIKLHDPSVERYTNKELIKKILNYSIPLTIYQALFYIGNLVDLWNTKARLMYSGFSDAQATILYGNLSKFNQLIGVPNAIIASLCVALLPSISASAARNEMKDVKTKINSAFKMCFLISVPSAVGLSVLSGPIFELIKYRGGANIMHVGAYVLIIMSAVQIFSAILQGLGKLYIVTFFLVFGVIGKIITNYFVIAIPSINIVGAIFGNVVYYMVPLILDNIILAKTLKIRLNIFVHAIKPAIASSIMGITIALVYQLLYKVMTLVVKGYIANAIPTIAAIVLGAYVYFFVMVLIKGITKNDMEVLPSKLRRVMPRSIQSRLKD